MFLVKELRRKLLAGALSMAIVFSSAVTLGISSNAQEELSVQTQDNMIVLLNLSKNISEIDSKAIKSETVNFCELCMESNSNLNISILSESNDEISDFTRDSSVLENTINLIGSNDGKDLFEGISKSKELIKDKGNGLFDKIVIISDINSQIDEFENIDAKQLECDENENQICADVYSVSISFSDKNNLKDNNILKNTQTKGYYEVSDLDSLNKALKSISRSLKESTPIIFIPGIMGSRLYDDVDCKSIVWTPEGSITQMIKTLSHLTSKMKLDNTLYVNRPVNQNKVSIKDREYGAFKIYKDMLDSLCDRFPDRDIYFFSYDFRQTNIDNGKKLDDFIDSLQVDKVDIIAHSMGGLVASNYISEKGNSKIDKIIIQGSPLEGAPQLLNAVMHWEIAGDYVQDLVLGSAGLVKQLKASYPSVAEMYPTKNYFDRTDFFVRSSWNWTKGSYNYDIIDYKTYEKYGKIIFADNYDLAVKEQLKQNIEGINILTTIDNSYFVFGTGVHTVKSVEFKDGKTLKEIDTCKDSQVEDLIYETAGDGTVPYLSYTSIENVNKNVDPSHIAYFDKMNHVNIAGSFDRKDKRSIEEKMTPINWVLDVIDKGYSDNDCNHTPTSRSFTVLKLDENADITVEKDGKILSSDSNDFAMLSDFGRLDFIGDENDTKILAIDDDKNYNIKISAKQAGDINYSVRWYNEEENLTEEVDFVNIPVTENTKIVTTADKNADITLDVDVNGDGNDIQEVTPTSIAKVEEVCEFDDNVYEGLSVIKTPDENYDKIKVMSVKEINRDKDNGLKNSKNESNKDEIEVNNEEHFPVAVIVSISAAVCITVIIFIKRKKRSN